MSASLAELFESLSLTGDGKEAGPSVLCEASLEAVAQHIRSTAKNIIIMAGAGISVAAGIPDFRTPGTGLYDNLQKYNLPNPQAVFSIDYFRENPKPFCMLAKELYPGTFKPTVAHYLNVLLHQEGRLLRTYTQVCVCPPAFCFILILTNNPPLPLLQRSNTKKTEYRHA